MQTERLKWTGEKYKEKLRQLKEDCHLTAFVAVIQAASKHFGAREKATVDEISNYTVADKTPAAEIARRAAWCLPVFPSGNGWPQFPLKPRKQKPLETDTSPAPEEAATTPC